MILHDSGMVGRRKGDSAGRVGRCADGSHVWGEPRQSFTEKVGYRACLRYPCCAVELVALPRRRRSDW